MSTHDDILREQIAYYATRAGEYDEWFLRKNRYDRGPELNQQWFSEIANVAEALDRFDVRGNVLELACGTGLWTQRLVPAATHLTAVDAAAEVLALNAARLPGANVRYIQADLFNWEPDGQYDTIFFSFWLSHVPPERFAGFWSMLGRALAPGGRVFFIDSRYAESSTAIDHRLEAEDATTQTRRLNDGREFRIVKVFYKPHELQVSLQRLGWHCAPRTTANYFIFGSATRAT